MPKIFKSSWWLILILILGLGLRLIHLNGSFWLDEAAQVLESSRPLAQQFNITHDFQPPLIHLLVHFSLKFSREEWWLRTMAALVPGLITITITYLIGRRLYSHQVGLLASLFLATSSLHIFYSQELRPYSLPAMWAALSWWLLIKSSKLDSNRKNLITYIMVSILGLYSSYLYPFLLLSQLVYLVLFKKIKISKLVLILATILVAYLPWLPTFWQQLQVGQSWRNKIPGWEQVVSLSQLEALPLVIGKFLFGVIRLGFQPGIVLVTIIATILVLIVFRQLWSNTSKKEKQPFLLNLSWLLLPLITAWLVSFLVPVMRPKRLLYLLPAFYLFLAKITLNYQSRHSLLGVNVGNLLIGLILIINFWSTSQYYLSPQYQREDWRGLTQQISQRFPKQDSIAVFAFTQPFAPWIWYNGGRVNNLATGSLVTPDQNKLATKLKPALEYRYVLIFDYLRDLTDPDDLIIHFFEQHGYHGIGVIDQPNIGFVRIYTNQPLLSDANVNNS